jgi:hypothetical protein
MDDMTAILAFGAVIAFTAITLISLFLLTIMFGDNHAEETWDDLD